MTQIIEIYNNLLIMCLDVQDGNIIPLNGISTDCTNKQLSNEYFELVKEQVPDWRDREFLVVPLDDDLSIADQQLEHLLNLDDISISKDLVGSYKILGKDLFLMFY